MTVFLSVLDAPIDEKAHDLWGEIRNLNEARHSGEMKSRTFEQPLARFSKVPGSPFAYWLTPRLFDLFQSLPQFDDGSRVTRVGLGTLADYRFLRLWYECSPLSLGNIWVPLANGGSFSRYFSDITQVVLWHKSGRCLKAYVEAKVGSASRKVQSEAFYFRSGITWPLRAKSFCPQILPSGCAFSARGYAAFVPSEEILPLAALGSSSAFDAFYKIMLGRFGYPEFLVGVLGHVPMPMWELGDQKRLGKLAQRAWSLRRKLDGTLETSHAFVLPPGLYERATEIDTNQIQHELCVIQAEVDLCAFELYGIAAEERMTLKTAVGAEAGREDLEPEEYNDDDIDQESVTENEAGVAANFALLSWLVGVSFGRFDLRLATGERPIPPEPGPFDPLPAHSAGMLLNDSAMRGILVGDEGHRDDLSASLRSVSECVSQPVSEDARTWLAREFFPLHIKMYSKSRRKAPIYWQLATPSASYSVWLYIHAFTKDTLYKVQNDYVTPKLTHEERKLESLRHELGENPRAAERKILATQETFVDELRAFLDEVKRIAPLWNPDLDDGVILNFAPLWRLVPQRKPWQKELKATWDSLCDGEYDWAHLAMHLWPERVVPKCATDRSLAIAHDLEEIFWAEGADGKWKARATPTRPVEDLVCERTSPAVKAALKSLLEAPSAGGNGKKPRRGKNDA